MCLLRGTDWVFKFLWFCSTKGFSTAFPYCTANRWRNSILLQLQRDCKNQPCHERPVWTGEKYLAPSGTRSPDHPVRSQSLYQPTDGPEYTAKPTFPWRRPKIPFLKSDFLEGYFIKQLRPFRESQRLSIPWQYYFRFLKQNCQLALHYIHRSFLRPNIDLNWLYKYDRNRLACHCY